MALSVTSNFSISAGYASNNMRNSQTMMGKSINRISSGLRAPKPADDAVSYVAGTKLKADSLGYNMLSTGVQDAAAKLNMADSVLSDVNSGLLELRALAVARQTTTSDSDEQKALDNTASHIISALASVADSAQYKGAALLTEDDDMDVIYGLASTNKFTVTASDNLKTMAEQLESVENIESLSTIDDAIKAITTQRAHLGGNMSALETISNYLSDVASSADAAYTAVTEVDMAKEMTSYVKNNIQSQAAQAMVAQANQGLAQVLNLLQV